MTQLRNDAPRDEISLLEAWHAVVRYRMTVAICACALVGLGVLIAVLSTPIYRSTVLLAPARDGGNSSALARAAGQFAGLASLAGIQLEQAGSLEQAVALLNSRAFTAKFIEEEGLLYELYADVWDPVQEKWLVEDKRDEPTVHKAVNFFNEHVRSVRVDKETGLVTLAIEWREPELAARWANRLVERLNEYMRARAKDEMAARVQYLQRELEKTSITGVQNVIYGLIENQISNAMLAEVQEEYAFRVLDPAVASMPWEYVRPKRLLTVVVCAFLGVMLGVVVALLRFLVKRSDLAGNPGKPVQA